MPVKKNISLLVTLALVLLVQGCSTVNDSATWKKTRSLYFTYVNAPEQVSLNKQISITDAETQLATNLMRIDDQLTKFEHAFEILNLPPAVTEIQGFFYKFPWIAGIILVNMDGNVTGALPEQYPSLDFSPLNELPPNQNDRDPRIVVDEATQLILVARPAYAPNGEQMGIFIVYFDIRSLFRYVNMDPSIFVLAGNTPLWLGDYTIDQTPLDGIDFIEATKNRTRDQHSNDNGSAIWINRYFYYQPLIFSIMQQSENFSLVPEFLKSSDSNEEIEEEVEETIEEVEEEIHEVSEEITETADEIVDETTETIEETVEEITEEISEATIEITSEEVTE